MIIILRIKNPLKWCLWLLLMKQSGINPDWSIWIIESLIFSHFKGLRFGSDLYDSDEQKAPFPWTLGCSTWAVDGMVSKGSYRSNALNAQRKQSSNEIAISLPHKSQIPLFCCRSFGGYWRLLTPLKCCWGLEESTREGRSAELSQQSGPCWGNWCLWELLLHGTCRSLSWSLLRSCNHSSYWSAPEPAR